MERMKGKAMNKMLVRLAPLPVVMSTILRRGPRML